jgi:RNA polymerase sigma-70 factor (ECF subfamily)
MEHVRRQLKDVLPSLRRFARALARHKPDADDLVQMTCERALERAGQWQEETRLESWLFRIMQTIWLDEVRARKVRDRYQDSEQSKLSDGSELMTPGTSEAKLMLQRVENEIFKLPESERILLILICVEGYSHREAAEVVRIPIGTVMSRLARARLNLADRLGDADRAATGNLRVVSK